VLETLDTAGAALTAKFEREREAASEALDFERAAALHKRLEKVSGALGGVPEIARRIEDLDGVILQRSAEEKTVMVFPLRSGFLDEPCVLNFIELSSQPRSVEAILRERLEPKSEGAAITAPQTAADTASLAAVAGEVDFRARYGLRAVPVELGEHLALVTRWFYSKPREGEILFRGGEWPYRRILRACSRLLAPPGPPAASGEPRKFGV
jgi:excinuclease ABC subunit C